MIVEFTSESREDLFEAVEYYEAKDQGLGRRFRDEVAQTLKAISGNPFLWRERPKGYRRVNCPVFPYYVAYVIRGDAIVVVAVAHGARKPGFWYNRLK